VPTIEVAITHRSHDGNANELFLAACFFLARVIPKENIFYSTEILRAKRSRHKTAYYADNIARQ
jgi:hypothetical protein